MNAEFSAIKIVDLGIVGGERIVGKIVKPSVWCA
jgi:hypothetical protein